MQELSAEGRRIVEDMAQRHGVSVETVTLLLSALAAGGGTQAQFNIQELGGMGQWSRGGMTMVGDMFNNGLKARVDSLCSDLSGQMGSVQVYAAAMQSQSQGSRASLFAAGGSGAWWPDGLGWAGSSGSQNDQRYAIFPETQRLAVEMRGRVTVYDTGEHRIGGVSQQQGGDQSLTFTSQYGLVRAADLPVVSGAGEADAPTPQEADAPTKPLRAVPELLPERVPESARAPRPGATSPMEEQAASKAGSEDDIFLKLERIADLHKKGVLTDAEFEAKKAELLSRL